MNDTDARYVEHYLEVVAQLSVRWSAFNSTRSIWTEWLADSAQVFHAQETAMRRSTSAPWGDFCVRFAIDAPELLDILLSPEQNREWLEAAATATPERLDLPSVRCRIFGRLGNAYFRLGQPSRAHHYWSEALALATAQGDVVNMSRWSGNLARVHQARGDQSKAIERLEYALDLAVDANDQRLVAHWTGNLAMLIPNDRDRSSALFQRSIAAYVALGDESGVAFRYLDMARTGFGVDVPSSRVLHWLDLAERAWPPELDNVGPNSRDALLAGVIYLRGRVALADSDYELAEALFDAALDLRARTDGMIGAALFSLGRLRLENSGGHTGLDELKRARDYYLLREQAIEAEECRQLIEYWQRSDNRES